MLSAKPVAPSSKPVSFQDNCRVYESILYYDTRVEFYGLSGMIPLIAIAHFTLVIDDVPGASK